MTSNHPTKPAVPTPVDLLAQIMEQANQKSQELEAEQCRLLQILGNSYAQPPDPTRPAIDAGEEWLQSEAADKTRRAGTFDQ